MGEDADYYMDWDKYLQEGQHAQPNACVRTALAAYYSSVLSGMDEEDWILVLAHLDANTREQLRSIIMSQPAKPNAPDAGDKYLVTKEYVTIVRQILSGIRLYRGKMNGANYLETLAKGLEAEPTPAVVVQPTAPNAGDVEDTIGAPPDDTPTGHAHAGPMITLADAGDVGTGPQGDRRAMTYMTLIRRLDEAAAREAQLRRALEKTDARLSWMEDRETKERNKDLLATPPSEAAQRVLAVIEAACELTDGIRNRSAGFTISADRLMEKVDDLRALDGKDEPK